MLEQGIWHIFIVCFCHPHCSLTLNKTGEISFTFRAQEEATQPQPLPTAAMMRRPSPHTTGETTPAMRKRLLRHSWKLKSRNDRALLPEQSICTTGMRRRRKITLTCVSAKAPMKISQSWGRKGRLFHHNRLRWSLGPRSQWGEKLSMFHSRGLKKMTANAWLHVGILLCIFKYISFSLSPPLSVRVSLSRHLSPFTLLFSVNISV